MAHRSARVDGIDQLHGAAFIPPFLLGIALFFFMISECTFRTRRCDGSKRNTIEGAAKNSRYKSRNCFSISPPCLKKCLISFHSSPPCLQEGKIPSPPPPFQIPVNSELLSLGLALKPRLESSRSDSYVEAISFSF